MKALLLVALSLVACGSEAPVATESSRETSGEMRIEASPTAELVRGANTFSVTVSPDDLDTSLEVTTWMPAMGHGASVKPTVVSEKPGIFRVENVVFSMPGTWEVRVRATCARMQGTRTFVFDVR
jgi:hypothetical protein